MLLSSLSPIKMLASVTSVEEALIALDAGVDMVDLKNPLAGALGALEYDLVKDIVLAINHDSCVSATIGDLAMEPSLIVEATKAMLETGVDIVKIGFFGQMHHIECLEALMSLAAKNKLIAVLFADEQPDFALLPIIAKAGFYGVMLDTANKNGSNLLNHMSQLQLAHFVSKAKSFTLEVGLAGSIQSTHVDVLSQTQPSYLGFRSAICKDEIRTSKIDPQKILSIKKQLY
ncbi:MAG: (5-formylfuran-3-yl)methyl phosphate synthase [Burkholderiaceae bacterium]|nr:(5-formylfuran-3-yl)methyl phosphate synthase [Burkholderiaceae bacterium]